MALVEASSDEDLPDRTSIILKIPEETLFIENYDGFNYINAIIEVRFPASVAVIGSNSFEGCSRLSIIRFPDNSEIGWINPTAFKDTRLESIYCSSKRIKFMMSAIPNVRYIVCNAAGKLYRHNVGVDFEVKDIEIEVGDLDGVFHIKEQLLDRLPEDLHQQLVGGLPDDVHPHVHPEDIELYYNNEIVTLDRILEGEIDFKDIIVRCEEEDEEDEEDEEGVERGIEGEDVISRDSDSDDDSDEVVWDLAKDEDEDEDGLIIIVLAPSSRN